MRDNEYPGAAAALAVSGGRPHVQAAFGHFRPDRKLLAIELWAYPTSTPEQLSTVLRSVEMAVYAWRHLPAGWEVRAYASKRPQREPWSGKRKA
jgi:hypothetical protein